MLNQAGRLWSIVGLMVATVALTGCGGAGLGEVSGKVTFQGKPLPSGRIVFFCEGGGKPVISAQIADGKYTILNAAAGTAKVTVATFQISQVAVPGAIQSPTPTDAPAAPTGPYVAIPDRYKMPDTSGLTYTVTAGRQTKDFELTP